MCAIPRRAAQVVTVTTVRRTSLARQVGRLSEGDLVRLGRALLVFLGLAVSGHSAGDSTDSAPSRFAVRRVLPASRAEQREAAA